MILVLFGTNPYSFDRLAKAIEIYANKSGEEIVVQLGNTTYYPKGVKYFDFISRSELIQFIKDAEIIVTQGGFGSISDCLERKKRIVVVPRKRELNECQDDGLGQAELVQELEKQGKIVGVYDVNNLPEAIEKARDLKPTFEFNSRIPVLVRDFMKSVLKQK